MNKAVDTVALGARIRQAAVEAGLSLRELGEKMNVSKPTIYAYAAGTLRIPERRLHELSRLLGLPVDYFLATDDELKLEGERQLELIDALLSPPDPERAIAIATAIARRDEREAAEKLRADAMVRAGNSLILVGNYLEAARQLELAKHEFLRLEETETLGPCCQSLAYCELNLGRLESAKRNFELAAVYYGAEFRWMPEVGIAAYLERIGQWEASRAKLKALRTDRDVSLQTEVYLRANEASAWVTQTHWLQALEVVEEATPQSYDARQVDQICEFLAMGGRALTHLGRLEEASLTLIRAEEASKAADDAARIVVCQLAWAELLAFAGYFDEARDIADAALATATERQYRRSEANGLLALARIAAVSGDLRLARGYARQAASFCEANSYPAHRLIAESIVASARLELGDVTGLQATVTDLLQGGQIGTVCEAEIRMRAVLSALDGSGSDGWIRQAEGLEMWPLIAELSRTRRIGQILRDSGAVEGWRARMNFAKIWRKTPIGASPCQVAIDETT